MPRLLPWSLFAVLSAFAPALAAPMVATRPLDGYVCKRLNLSPASMRDPTTPDVLILQEPRLGAPRSSIASAMVLVSDPPVLQNGYVQVMQLTGKPGWIKADMVVPLPPDVLCSPSIMSNGKPGFG